MIPFHSLLPELAQREVRCVHFGAAPASVPEPVLPADEYIYLEFYCDDLKCDCRRVFLQVIAKGQPGKVFASISYGWEKESFYRKRMPWDPDEAKGTVRGEKRSCRIKSFNHGSVRPLKSGFALRTSPCGWKIYSILPRTRAIKAMRITTPLAASCQ